MELDANFTSPSRYSVWPANLVYCALFNTLHHQQYAGIGSRGGISRERFFLYAFIGSCAWFFFPGYIFQGKAVLFQLDRC